MATPQTFESLVTLTTVNTWVTGSAASITATYTELVWGNIQTDDAGKLVTYTTSWGPLIPLSLSSASTTTTTDESKTKGSTTSTSSSSKTTFSATIQGSGAAHRNDSGAGFSGGAIAGIAIATAIAGLIIGAIAALFLLRRKRQHSPRPEYVPMQYKEKDALPPLPTGGVQLNQFLLESKSDQEIVSELRSLGNLIQQHVENAYHLQPVQRGANALTPALVGLGFSQTESLSPSHVASLALDPRTRYATLQYVIARVAFESTAFLSHSSISLLPPFVTAFIREMPPVEQHRGSSQAVAAALTKWRQLTAFLMHPNRADRQPLTPSEDVSTHQAQKLAVALNKFLGPFIAGDRETRYEQENHLREVIVECATFAYLIFSQPAGYEFRFDDGHGLVVCPGLDRVSDEDGRKYPSPQRVAAPVAESV